MQNATITIPYDALPSVINILTDTVNKLQEELECQNHKLSDSQFRVHELTNQIEYLKNENIKMKRIEEKNYDF